MELTGRRLTLVAVTSVAAVLALVVWFTRGSSAPSPSAEITSSLAAPESRSASPTVSPLSSSRSSAEPSTNVSQGPILVQPTGKPDVKEAATAFGAAWLNTYGRSAENWRARLTPRVTSDLARDLAAADPGAVPVGAKVSEVAVTTQPVGADALIVTADAQEQPLGTLHLTLVHEGGEWRISGLKWEPRP